MMVKPKGKSKKQSPASKAEDTLQPDNFPCPFCEKVFKNRSSLTRHIKIHDEFKELAFDDEDVAGERYPCSECSKTFAKKQNLSSHMKTHSTMFCVNEDDASCDTQNFEDEEEDLFPFECPDCSECFSENRFLIAHLSTHKVTKLYNCKMCSSTFANKLALTKHTATHTSSKSFKCKFCPSAFDTAAARREHGRLHIFWCGVCDVSFNTLGEYTAHVVNSHKNYSSNTVKREACDDSSDESSDSDSNGPAPRKIMQKTAKSSFPGYVSRQPDVSFENVSHTLKKENADDCFICLECKVQFQTETALLEHSMNCSLLRYLCSSPQCNNLSFNNKAAFLDHMRTKHLLLPQAKEQVPVRANVHESVNPPASYIITSPNASSSSIGGENYVSQNTQVYQLGGDVSTILNQTLLMDPLLFSTGFVPQRVDPTTAYMDFNIESYIPWFQKFLNLMKSCEYPLRFELFERITHCLKVISNVIGCPISKIKDKQNFALLWKFHEEFSKISKNHLMHIADGICK